VFYLKDVGTVGTFTILVTVPPARALFKKTLGLFEI
jgi:hypothetical protein